MASLSAEEELLLLRKRARRRLVGAVVLVAIATTVLWKVLGRAPVQAIRPESVVVTNVNPANTTSEHAAASAPQVAPHQAISSLAEPVTTESKQEKLDKKEADSHPPTPAGMAPPPKHAAPASSPPRPADHPSARAKSATPAETPHSAVDPAAILEGRSDRAAHAAPAKQAAASGKFVLQLAALSDPDKAQALKAKLAELGVEAHFSKVQTSKGFVTRVRAGPFTSRADANVVLKKLEHAGVSGIVMEQ